VSQPIVNPSEARQRGGGDCDQDRAERRVGRDRGRRAVGARQRPDLEQPDWRGPDRQRQHAHGPAAQPVRGRAEDDRALEGREGRAAKAAQQQQRDR
jgi:hypothetical protein